MKSLLFVLFLISFFSIKAEYNLLVYGDIGQVDIFNSRNPGKLYNNQLKANKTVEQATQSVQNLLGEEQYIYEGGKCGLNLKGKPLNLTKQRYTNFNRLLCASNKYIKNSDHITILGDMVYAESKGLPVNRTNLINEEIQQRLEERTACGMNWFEDMMENYKNYCPKGTNDAHKKLWDSKNHKIGKNFYILEGNHAFDVNYKDVSEGIADMSTANAYYVGTGLKSQKNIKSHYLHTYPRFISVEKNGTKLEFVDINTIILVMLLDADKGKIRTKAEYKEASSKVYRISKIPSYRSALKYLKYTFKAINKFTSTSHWRIIRSHHPPMNVEGGFNEQKYFWTVKYEGQSLFDLIKKKNVKIYLASHHHSGHVLAFPYNQFDNLRTKKLQDNKEKVPTGHCLYHNPKDFKNNLKNSTLLNTCPDKAPHFTLKENFNSNKNGYLWIFVAGNSGRELDEMEGANKSRSSLVWGRAVPRQYGGVNFRFNRHKFEATFFEVNEKGNNVEVAYFNFINTNETTSYNIIDQEVTNKLK